MLVGIIDRDLEHASVEHIAGIVARFVERAERERERELVARIEEGLGTGGPAAAGLDKVLSTLEHRRVAVLLVPESGSLRAGLRPNCGRLPTDGGRTCPLDGSPLAPVDAVAQVVQDAGRQAAQVVVVHGHYEWLCNHGGIAALLR
ncbi:MAG TPA: hypothetical protein VEF89_06260 [Solirubrobacteraceae bacterium]|nr:hypothetical protein [Solirubrobacteraceae bacterium]